jgi:D-aminoacyl-tRNA deacylase
MKIAIITSTEDQASMHMHKHFLQLGFTQTTETFQEHKVYSLAEANTKSNIKLYTTSLPIVRAEGIDQEISADFFIFASRHHGKDGRPCFTLHPTGNWNKEYGGKDKTLSPLLPGALKQCFIIMNNTIQKEPIALPDFHVTLEATHHGPLLNKPSCFMELGSDKTAWGDKRLAKRLAGIIIECAKAISQEKMHEKIKNYQNVVGLGGTHYCSNFNKIQLNQENNIAVGHVCPKHHLEFLNENMLKQAIETSQAELVLLDWKGLGKEKERIITLLEKLKIEYKKTKEI